MSQIETSLKSESVNRSVTESLVPRPSRTTGRAQQWFGRLVSALVITACIAGVVYLGQTTGWRMSSASALFGNTEASPDDWCEEHSVPESICVECGHGEVRPREYGWCRTHGVHECPLCHPDVAQIPSPEVTEEDRERAERGLSFAPRAENGRRCRQHQRRLQLASATIADQLGLTVAPAVRARVTESIESPGEIEYDPTRVARVSSRIPGTVWRVDKQIGDQVQAGEVLALVDAAAVGQAKAEFIAALTRLRIARTTLSRTRTLSGAALPERELLAAEAKLEEAEASLLTAEQALLNLGMIPPAPELRELPPTELGRRIQFLGLPGSLARHLSTSTGSSNLLAVTSPLTGEIVGRDAVIGESVAPDRPLFVVADTRQLWLTVRVPLGDVGKVRPGQTVYFQHAGHTGKDGDDTGTVVWVSPAADEVTRTVDVRVDLPNTDGRHHVNQFGTARVVLREERAATVVPSSAVHWEGCCHVVFVRDRDYEAPESAKVFHVRKVRPGVKDVTPAGPVTEILAGVLPGEVVATENSGILRSELLKNDLGAG